MASTQAAMRSPPASSPTVAAPNPAIVQVGSQDGLWDRVSKFVSENKVAVYTIGAVVVIAGAGGIYYVSSRGDKSVKAPRSSKKDKKREKSKKKEEAAAKEAPKTPKVETAAEEESLPEVDENTVETLSDEQRKDFAARLKAAGNKAYGSKDYNLAIDLYTKAILCKADPIFYSNRSACYNALNDWEKVVEDTTAAIALDPEYVKALNRRSNAYENLGKYSEALLDSTASCIIDHFRNEGAAQSVERLLKKVAETKGSAMLEGKPKRLPSPTFVTNFLQSFRSKPVPEGLEISASLEENSGDYHMRQGLNAVERRTADGYEEADASFEKALELGVSDQYKALALNWRATFRYLKGDSTAALEDLGQSIQLDPKLTQSYIKQASIKLELGNREEAARDFELAIEQNPDDPDIYYYRAQLYFISGEFGEAAKDYQKSIDLDRDFIFSHIQLGVTQYKMGSIASSMATFRRCIKNFEKVPEVYNYYGELLLDQQKYPEAIEQFDKAVEMEKSQKPMGMNVLPLINKALTMFQWKQDFGEAEELCKKALIIDPDCDIAVATMAQLLLQQGKVKDALVYFERAAELARTEGEIVNALSYAEATRAQLEVQEKYPKLTERLASGMGGMRPQ